MIATFLRDVAPDVVIVAVIALCLLPVALRLKRERGAAKFRKGVMEECERTPMLPADAEPEWGPSLAENVRGIALRQEELRRMRANMRRVSAFAPDTAASAELLAGGDGREATS